MHARYRSSFYVFLTALFCASYTGCASVGSPAQEYHSGIGMEGATWQAEHNSSGFRLHVGDHFETRIRYTIGWYDPCPDTCTIVITRPAITNPEYQLFSATGALPEGLSFNSDTGVLSGIPARSGIWRFHPAVRDRVNGENPYRGRGYWFTDYTTWQGHTWIESKDALVFDVRR